MWPICNGPLAYGKAAVIVYRLNFFMNKILRPERLILLLVVKLGDQNPVKTGFRRNMIPGAKMIIELELKKFLFRPW